jgi:SSS family transporter
MSISFWTSKNSDSQDFFNAHKQSPWYLVAYGMIGATISGITFISVPGAVYNDKFAYLELTLGYIAGYLTIAWLLMPTYYRMNVVSIYTYLENRFGFWSYKTGSFFFLLSRTLGSALRLFLAVMVLQVGVFGAWGFPLWLTSLVSVALIWVYTYRGGIKTIVWTDTFQTTFLIMALISSIFLIKNALDWSWRTMFQEIYTSQYSQVFFFDNSKNNFFKQFIGGMFIAICMSGLDQDIMQKNLTCKNLKEAQKNMYWFIAVFCLVVFIFVCLGSMLYLYADKMNVALPMKDGKILTDKVYPFLAFNHFGIFAGVTFLLGIVAATYASSDSALTSLTTAFCLDFLHLKDKTENQKQITIRIVHLSFSLLLVILIVLFEQFTILYPNTNVIGILLKVSTYTYGPLLGLFAFGLFTKYSIKDKFVPIICVISPILSFLLDAYSPQLLGYIFGFEILAVNGLLTSLGLWLIKK